MKQVVRNFALPVFLLLAGILTVSAIGWLPASDASRGDLAERANLALRHTGDRLLDLAGDSTVAIAPVEQPVAGTLLLRLEHNFNYDSLPVFLEKSFIKYNIRDDYYVSVTDCTRHLLMLGFAASDLKESGAACGGRFQEAGCYNVKVTFGSYLNKAYWQQPEAWAITISAVAVLLFFAGHIRRFFQQKPVLPTLESASAVDLAAHTASSLYFGRCIFEPANQCVTVQGQPKPLTYREAKLLGVFCRSQNQLLERDYLLKEVWEDEGLLVGRSLDVFVSRLRKILQADPSVKIANVHGVGYRMEVTFGTQDMSLVDK